jgi:short-subunit dehydrogenase
MTEKGLAIITGASQGIGACVAHGLALDGYKTVLIARNKLKLEMVANEIKDLGSNIQAPIFIPLDITDHQNVRKELKSLISTGQNISILVNCAAIWLDGSLAETDDNFSHLLDVNLISAYVILQEIVGIMKKQKNGYIFNIASRAGKYGFPGGGIYSSSKFALIGLSESLYRELAPDNIKVTSICPGWVNTEMAKLCNTPLADIDMIQPSDILNSIRYLLNLSESTCIKELVLECTKSIL